MAAPIFFPEKAYPSLYEAVMHFKLFPDSKSFADAVPLVSPEEINALYKKVNANERAQVEEFVLQWFKLPGTNEEIELHAGNVSKHIHMLWDFLIRESTEALPNSSLIPLPYPYVVPGGRFREIYYWDSYFTMLGLRESDHFSVIENMIRNFAWMIDQFGHIPNGNRSYFISRSQPPFFSYMIELEAERKGSLVYVQYLPQLLKEYAFWMDDSEINEQSFRRKVQVKEGHYLNRYYDNENAPRPESYAEDQQLWNTSTQDKEHLYLNLRAACESGWDFSSRWFGDEKELASIQTTNLIPVDLNALLYHLEKTIAKGWEEEGDKAKAYVFNSNAEQRANLIRSILWDEENGIFNDWDFVKNKHGEPSLAMMYVLFANIASPDQATSCIQYLSTYFLRPGGWVTTNQNTGEQWDAPNGWAPLQWITYMGLKNYDAIDLAIDAAQRWLTLNEKVFSRTGRMMEKYNVEDMSLDAGGGEYPVQDGFGWTNGVYLALMKELNNSVSPK